MRTIIIVFVAMMSATLCVKAAAGDPQVLELLGRWGRGPSYEVEIDGDLAFIGSGSNVLIADVTDMENLQIIGEIVLPDVVRGLSLEGDLLAVGASDGGGHFIDVSNPYQAVHLGSIEAQTYRRYNGVVLKGGIAFFAGSGVLIIVDCLDPSDPLLVGVLEGSGDLRLVVDDNAYAYLPSWGSVTTVDVLDPAFPTEVGHYVTYAARAVSLDDSYLYSAGSQGFVVLDYSVPAVLQQVGFLEMADVGSGMDIEGNRAYVAAGGDGFTVIDVSNPVVPVVAGSLASDGWWGGYTIAVSGQKAAASDFFVFRLLDLTQPDVPVETDRLDLPGYAWSAAISGNLILVGDWTQGLRVLDFSNPGKPFEVGFVTLPGYVEDVAVGGHIAVLANQGDGITIVDFAEPTAPRVVGVLDTPGVARNVVVSGGLALVADADGGLRVIDISAPVLPVELGSYDPAAEVVDVAVSGNHAFLALKDVGIRCVDLSNPASPIPMGIVHTLGSPTAVDVDGGLLVSAHDDSSGMLQVIDVSAPGVMTWLGYWSSPISWHRASDVGIGEGMAFLIGSENRVHVFDLSDPTTPARVMEMPGMRERMGVEVSGRRVVFAEMDAGVALHFNSYGMLFLDDFETGDTSAWSEVVQ